MGDEKIMEKKTKCWRRSKPRKDLIVYEMGRKRPGSKFNLAKNAILIEEKSDYVKKNFPGSNWEVRSNLKINPKTVSGRFKSFKTKSGAIQFAKKVMKKHGGEC